MADNTEDFAHGNTPAIALDSKVTWHVPGHGPLSGDYAGLESIGDFFGGSSEDRFSMDVDKVFGDDDVVVVLVTVNEQRLANEKRKGDRVRQISRR
jgi:uncharacterized protein